MSVNEFNANDKKVLADAGINYGNFNHIKLKSECGKYTLIPGTRANRPRYTMFEQETDNNKELKSAERMTAITFNNLEFFNHIESFLLMLRNPQKRTAEHVSLNTVYKDGKPTDIVDFQSAIRLVKNDKNEVRLYVLKEKELSLLSSTDEKFLSKAIEFTLKSNKKYAVEKVDQAVQDPMKHTFAYTMAWLRRVRSAMNTHLEQALKHTSVVPKKN